MEEENVEITSGCDTAIFLNIIRHSFEFPEACMGSYIKAVWTIICWFDMAAW